MNYSYDYYLIVRQVYGQNYGNIEYLELYSNWHTVQMSNHFLAKKLTYFNQSLNTETDF